MMNFFHNMKLIPKNFVVAGIVDTLKSDPEAGAQKVFDLADKFVTDEAMIELLEEVKDAYYSRSSVRMYLKNLIYNTNKSALNHFLNNLVVKHLIDGAELREEIGQKLGKQIPYSFILNIGAGKKTMPEKEISRLVDEAKALGLHFIIVSGTGLNHPGFWAVCEKNSDVQFLVFSRMKEINGAVCQRLEAFPNIVPLIIAGTDPEGDMSPLKASGLLFGTLSETKPENFEAVTSDACVLPYIRQGSRISFFVTSKEAAINPDELLRIKHRIDYIRQVRPYITVHVESEKNGLEGHLHFEELIKDRVFQTKIPEIGPDLGKKKLVELF